MKRWSIYLGICLFVQVAMAVGAHLARTDYGAFRPMETLLSFDPKTVDGIVIEQNDKQQVTLKKQEGNWCVSQMNNFQANQDKVNDFLEKLSTLTKGWPVATTAAAARRFKVAGDDFERKITLSKNGESIASLFVGASPGFRKVHARHKGEDSIFAVDFSDYQASAKPEDWIDKGVLKHSVSEISRVQLPDLSLSHQGNNITVNDLADDEETVAEEAERLLRKLADLRTRAVRGSEEKAAYNPDKSVFRYTLTVSSGELEEYVFFKPKDSDCYILKPSHRKEYFEVDNWVVDNIKGTDRSKLVRKMVK
ncbi:MAG: DUF4340 domain-containing protein [Syntrophales bacterium]|nr:DUF4340 domain-containing protein [Syntrophales bacterium]